MTHVQSKDIREDFCGACLMVPFAFAGAGASAYGANAKKGYKNQKKILFWSGVVTVVIALFIAIWYLKSECSDCK